MDKCRRDGCENDALPEGMAGAGLCLVCVDAAIELADEGMTPSLARRALKQAFEADESFADSWHANIWAKIYDAGLDTWAANRVAAQIMDTFFDVNTVKPEHETPTTPLPMDPVAYGAILSRPYETEKEMSEAFARFYAGVRRLREIHRLADVVLVTRVHTRHDGKVGASLGISAMGDEHNTVGMLAWAFGRMQRDQKDRIRQLILGDE